MGYKTPTEPQQQLQQRQLQQQQLRQQKLQQQQQQQLLHLYFGVEASVEDILEGFLVLHAFLAQSLTRFQTRLSTNPKP